VTGQARKAEAKEPSAETKPPGDETKAPPGETAEAAAATNHETNIEAATGN